MDAHSVLIRMRIVGMGKDNILMDFRVLSFPMPYYILRVTWTLHWYLSARMGPGQLPSQLLEFAREELS
jgi:hypothetical protein